MQKKLIALAIAGAFVAPAAFADTGNVTIYGVMDASFDSVDSGTATNGNNGNRQLVVGSNSSRLGFKGSEDLGNGLSAVWQIESAINADGGGGGAGVLAVTNTTGAAGTLNTRNTFVGLSSKSWGTAILGRHDTPYKLATRNLDVFGDGIADNRSLMGGGSAGALASFDGRQSNVLAYISPTWNGFHAAIGYVTFENAAVANSATNQLNTQDHAWSVAGIYGNGPWFASLAYEKHSLENLFSTLAGAGISGTEEHAWKLGVGYSANNFRVGLAYEKTSDNVGSTAGACAFVGGASATSDCFGHNSWYLGGGYTFGNNEVKLAYTRAGNQGDSSNTGAKQWALGLDHNFSKRTKVYALYTKLNNDNAVGYDMLRGASSTNGLIDARVGTDPSAWSFGIRHNF